MESRRRNCKPFSLRRSHGAPISDDPPKSSRVSCDLFPDSIRRKKVKFAESATVMEKASNHDSPSFKSRKSQSPPFEDPKTFEYKIYKEIQEKTSSKRQNCQLSLEKIHKKASQEKDIMQEFGDSDKFKDCISRSLLPILDATPVIHALPCSSGNMSSTYDCENSSIFSKKRSRLLQLVTEPFSQGKEKLEVKRLDLISELLKRLGIEKNSLLCCEEHLASALNMSNDSIQSPASSETCFFDIENKTIATKKHFQKDLPSDKWLVDYDDDLRRASWNHAYFQTIPYWPGPENSFQQNNQTSLELVSAVDSELHDYMISSSIKQWIPNPKYDNKESRILGDCSTKSDYENLIEFPSGHSSEQSLVPYTNTKCLELFDPQSTEAQTCFPLLGWKEKTREPEHSYSMAHSEQSLVPYTNTKCLELFDPQSTEVQTCFPLLGWKEKTREPEHSYSMAHSESHHVSQNFFSASGLFSETESKYEREDIYNSLLADDCKMMVKDATSYLDILQPNPEGASELGGKTIPLDFVADYHISSHMEIQLRKEHIEDRSCLISSTRDDVAGEILSESQITCLASPLFYSGGF